MSNLKYKKALLIVNGELNIDENLLSFINQNKFDMVACTDGAFKYAEKLSINIDFIFGDLDSLQINKITIPKEKIIKKLDQNYTDLEFTLEKMSEMNCFRELIVIGCVGKSIDHEIANILSLSKFAGNFKIIALDKRNIIYFLKGPTTIDIKSEPGTIVSVISLSNVEGITYHGLLWELENKNVGWGWYGVRNVMKSNLASISIKEGNIMVITSKEESQIIKY